MKLCSSQYIHLYLRLFLWFVGILFLLCSSYTVRRNFSNWSTLLQGVRKFPPQLCQALASSYVDTIKYPFNHVILTPWEFFWHMKHNDTFGSSWVMDGNDFWNFSVKMSFSPVWLFNRKTKYPKMPSRANRAYFYHFHDDLHGQ